MRNWSLRARLTVVLATTLGVFAVVSTVAYLTHSRAEDRLGSGFADQIMVLSELPSHRSQLRRIDAFADNYLTTRDPVWLERRAELVRGFVATHARIGTLLHEPYERVEWEKMGREFAAYDAAQADLFRRVRTGGLARVEAIRQAIDNETVDDHIERMSHFGRLSMVRLDIPRGGGSRESAPPRRRPGPRRRAPGSSASPGSSR